MKKIIKLKFTLVWIFTFFFAQLGIAVTNSTVDRWYPTLQKPFFNPPNWLFAPVWILLYILMTISATIVWNKKGKKLVEKEFKVYALQLGLNLLWSIIFFGFKQPLLAFGEIIFLLFAIIWTMKIFKKTSQTAFWLLVPYLVWVSFASLLNLMIVLLN